MTYIFLNVAQAKDLVHFFAEHYPNIRNEFIIAVAEDVYKPKLHYMLELSDVPNDFGKVAFEKLSPDLLWVIRRKATAIYRELNENKKGTKALAKEVFEKYGLAKPMPEIYVSVPVHKPKLREKLLRQFPDIFNGISDPSISLEIEDSLYFCPEVVAAWSRIKRVFTETEINDMAVEIARIAGERQRAQKSRFSDFTARYYTKFITGKM